MAVGPVYPFTPPAPHAALLVNDEMALSVATPIGSAAGATTYRLARWFDFNGGIYTIKSVSADVASWLASISLNNARVLFNARLGESVVERVVFIPRGRKRLDILLTNVGSGASSCYVAFSIWQFGKLVYASSASGWVFDTAAIVDSAVPALGDRRLTFPLFPLLPNWAGGLTERIEWKSEVLSSESDVEQSRSLRRYPRRSIEASFLRGGVNRSRLDSFFLGVGKKELLLPLWHEQVYLTAALGQTYTFPTGTLALREFRNDDLVVAYRSPTDYELLTITPPDAGPPIGPPSDTIIFTTVPAGSWGPGDRIIPLRTAVLYDAVRFENQSDSVATAQARFDLIEPLTWPTPSWGPTPSLFGFVPNRSTALSIDFSRKTFTFDSETGPVDDTDVGDRARVGMRLNLTLFGRESVVALKAFLQSARGRGVRFWIPDFMKDIHLYDDIGGTQIDAVHSGFTEYILGPQAARTIIGIVYKDGSPTVYREVTNVTDEGAFERFHLGTSLPSATMASIALVTFMMPVRFDQDGFELHHHVDASAAMQTTLVVRSTDSTGMPAII